MEILRDPAEIASAPGGRSLAVGTFDGVHLGHRRVIDHAAEWGRLHGARVTVVTFDPHPLLILQPDEPPNLLTSPRLKADLIGALDVDELLFVPFTKAFSRMEAEEFCSTVLAEILRARRISVGENFRFGHEARGDARLLESCSEFETRVVPLVEHAGAPVSSTRIRDLLALGDVSEAARLLGAPFQLEGPVVEGDRRGRSLGMPTANLRPPPGIVVPAAGVYAGRALNRPAAISVGVRPTFETGGEVLIEAHLIGFEDDLYGSTLRIAFLERLRDELRFNSADELAEQMRRDVDRVRDVAGRQ